MNGLQRGGRSATAPRTDGSPVPDATTVASTFAQKLWRFTHNGKVPFSALLQPLLQTARTALLAKPGRVHLVVHDWSTLAFRTHPSKKDRKQLSHDRDLGYDLHLALLVDATDCVETNGPGGQAAEGRRTVARLAVGAWLPSPQFPRSGERPRERGQG